MKYRIWLSEAESNVALRLGYLATRNLIAPLGAAHWEELFGILSEPAVGPSPFWLAAYDGSGSTTAFLDLALNEWDLGARPQRPSAWAASQDPILALFSGSAD